MRGLERLSKLGSASQSSFHPENLIRAAYARRAATLLRFRSSKVNLSRMGSFHLSVWLYFCARRPIAETTSPKHLKYAASWICSPNESRVERRSSATHKP